MPGTYGHIYTKYEVSTPVCIDDANDDTNDDTRRTKHYWIRLLG